MSRIAQQKALTPILIAALALLAVCAGPSAPPGEAERTPGPFHILFAGGIHRARRIELILRAARKLTVPFLITLMDQEDRRDPEKPQVLQELRKLCQTLGIEDRVEFAERKSQDQMNALYEKADVFVHPAIYAGAHSQRDGAKVFFLRTSYSGSGDKNGDIDSLQQSGGSGGGPDRQLCSRFREVRRTNHHY